METRQEISPEPKLGKPGGGLPFVEWAAAKYILLPKLFKSMSKEDSLKSFADESGRILEIAQSLDSRMLTERRLVPRLRGMEDSSRYWSVPMTMQHLIVVGDLMREVVVELSHGGTQLKFVGTAEVKPELDVNPDSVCSRFRHMSDLFLNDTEKSEIDAFPEAKHRHPWFGPLTARQWLIFGGTHQNIHRKQIEEIVARLKA